MKTRDQIIECIRAREAGKMAAIEGQKMDSNPYGEADPLHWDWLDAWCVEWAQNGRVQSPNAAPSATGQEGKQ